MAEIEIDMSDEHERAKERVILFTNLGRVHELVEVRITNSPDGGVEINYLDSGRLVRVDMAKDGMVYVIFWDRNKVARMRRRTAEDHAGHPVGAVYDFSEEMMPALIHRIQNFLASGNDH